MKHLVQIYEEYWSDKVDMKWHPRKGFFAEKSPYNMAEYAMKEADWDESVAMKRVTFYMNRAGKNLKPEAEKTLNKVKRIFKSKYKDDKYHPQRNKNKE